MDQPFSSPITTSVQAQEAKPLTLDMLHETLKAGQQKMDDMNDKLVESLMLAGFTVMVNEIAPPGMIAVLSRDFKGSVERVKAKLKVLEMPYGNRFNNILNFGA